MEPVEYEVNVMLKGKNTNCSDEDEFSAADIVTIRVPLCTDGTESVPTEGILADPYALFTDRDSVTKRQHLVTTDNLFSSACDKFA
jgi:hypothetical protein